MFNILEKFHIAELLIKKGADVNIASKKFKQTPLHRAATYGIFVFSSYEQIDSLSFYHFYIILGHEKIVHLLIEHGADVNAVDDPDGDTVMFYAAYSSNWLIISRWITKIIVKFGSDLSHLDNENLVNLLIRNGAHVNVANKNGETPLYLAVMHGDAKLIKKLIKAGADATALDADDWSALHFATENGNIKVWCSNRVHSD